MGEKADLTTQTVNLFLYNLGVYKKCIGKKPCLLIPKDKKFGKGYLDLYLSDDFTEEVLKDPARYKPDFITALMYGYRGYSSGEQNGVFNIQDSDKGLLEKVKRYSNERGVKIVRHRPDGKRVVGIFPEKSEEILIIGEASY